MLLIDSSVWIDHLRCANKQLSQLLNSNQVSIHSMIIGELACGNLNNRSELLALWQQLPMVSEASHQEVIYAINQYQWMGKGIGYIDAHLLASTLLTDNTALWTLDKRLQQVAVLFGVAFCSTQ